MPDPATFTGPASYCWVMPTTNQGDTNMNSSEREARTRAVFEAAASQPSGTARPTAYVAVPGSAANLAAYASATRIGKPWTYQADQDMDDAERAVYARDGAQ